MSVILYFPVCSCRILVLEVLINQFEKIPDEGSDARPNTCAVPCPSNVQYLAADFVVQAHHIPKMTADRPNDSKVFNSAPNNKMLGFFIFNPLPDDKILDWSKLKKIADDILKCI